MPDKDRPESLSLDRSCELLVGNCAADKTNMLNLWQLFGHRLHSQLVQPCLDEQVMAVEVEVLSDDDFTLKQFRRSESLDLEALSDSFEVADGVPPPDSA